MSGTTLLGVIVLIVFAFFAAAWALDWWQKRRGRRE
jgi:hypothetical protein